MEKVSKAKHLVREAIALCKDPSVLPIVVLYWLMTRDMSKRTEEDRDAARRMFAAKMLGANPDSFFPKR